MGLNKNIMLPTYESSEENMNRALSDGEISSPCWVYLRDKGALVFISWETVDGNKVLKPHWILWEQVSTLEEQMDGLRDEETGEIIKVTDYVASEVDPVKDEVQTISSDVDEIKEQVGYTTMLVSTEEVVD